MIAVLSPTPPADVAATREQWRQIRQLGAVAWGSFTVMVNAGMQLLAVSSDTQSIITGVLLAAGLTLAASLRRLVKLSIRLAEEVVALRVAKVAAERTALTPDDIDKIEKAIRDEDG